MTTGTDSKIAKRLQEWEEREGSLPDSLEFYRRLLDIQSGAKSRVGIPSLDIGDESIRDRINAGTPLLGFEDLSIDWSLFQDIFKKVTALFASYSDVLGQVPENGKDSGSQLAFLKEATKAWFKGEQPSPETADNSTSEAALELVISATFSPFLVRYCEALIGAVDQEQWRRGYCPICGGSPDFAFLDKERGARWLLCSRCDAEWLFQRLECPYCGTQDQSALAYFTDDKGLYRLYVCEQCRHYLKAVDLQQADYEVLLPLERFLTLDIDIQAHQDGYSPPVTKAGGKRG